MRSHKRISGENCYHHIYAWGNDRHPVFKEQHQYKHYLKLMANFSKNYVIDVIAYALMEWHVHLFIFDKINKISLFIQKLHGEYALYFNAETGRVGHVFGERFNNKIVQPNNYGIWLSRYIHRQPVEASLVSDPRDYPWTSFRQYIGLEPVEFIKPEIILSQFSENKSNQKESVKAYDEFVSGEKEDTVEWESPKPNIIGDLRFIQKTASRLKLNRYGIVNKNELLHYLCKELNTTPGTIFNPGSRKETALRKMAIGILFRKYRLKIAEIACLLKISRFTVMRTLK